MAFFLKYWVIAGGAAMKTILLFSLVLVTQGSFAVSLGKTISDDHAKFERCRNKCSTAGLRDGWDNLLIGQCVKNHCLGSKEEDSEKAKIQSAEAHPQSYYEVQPEAVSSR